MDLDVLHSVIDKIKSPSQFPECGDRCGKTAAFLEMMIGEALLGDDDNVYVYVAKDYDSAANIQYAFAAKLNDENISFDSLKVADEIVTENNQSFMFLSPEHDETLKGYTVHRAFVDVSYTTYTDNMNWFELLFLLTDQEADSWVIC